MLNPTEYRWRMISKNRLRDLHSDHAEMRRRNRTMRHSLAACGVPPAAKLALWMLAAVLVPFLGLTVLSDKAAAQVKFTEDAGALPDGTTYLMRVPVGWNRTLIRDLDDAASPDNSRSAYWLEVDQFRQIRYNRVWSPE
jgi:hypothetical protein